MSDDGITLQELAETEQICRAIGDIELVADETAPVSGLRPTDAPGNVIRPVRVPFDVDTQVRQLVERRGMSISAMLRELIVAGIAALGSAPDPLTELRRSLNDAQRAVESIASDRIRHAA